MMEAVTIHEVAIEVKPDQLVANSLLSGIPGIMFVDHVAIAVRQGELDGQVKAYQMLGFREVHREEVLG